MWLSQLLYAAATVYHPAAAAYTVATQILGVALLLYWQAPSLPRSRPPYLSLPLPPTDAHYIFPQGGGAAEVDEWRNGVCVACHEGLSAVRADCKTISG